MGSLYRSQHELVFVFKAGKGAHRNNIQLGRFGRNRTNVWHYPGANTLSRTGEEGDLLAMHPTVKPVALVADALLDVSARGEIVLDCFLGFGSTVLAAERVSRICYGMEFEPRYVDLAIRRWQQMTGEQAVHEPTGRTLNEMLTSKQPSRKRRPRMSEDEQIGYGKPPRANQFRTGQSGNPQGRPRGTRNFASVFHEVIAQQVQLRENGRKRRITKLEAILMQMVNKATAGDPKAMKETIQLLRVLDIESQQEDVTGGPDKEKDQAIMQRLKRRFASSAVAPENVEEDPLGNTAL